MKRYLSHQKHCFLKRRPRRITLYYSRSRDATGTAYRLAIGQSVNTTGIMRVDVTPRFRELAPARPSTTFKSPTVFTLEAMELLQSLSHVENLLRLVKPRYLQPKSFIRIHKGPRMSEKEKDELDADLLELIKNCSSRINALKLAEEAQREI
ncbi:hypothetical protein PsorP6_005896 [Peronosclerospora sorghi]|uniref:Uncharacterized protein n=1 Tax=Peronosclerospora sorghi TaxID=230839 RepID=A0ACC0W3X6_9STRA|nr:hypothetical protein PsorP6_005896 [Peronosclerospora sorghi]